MLVRFGEIFDQAFNYHLDRHFFAVVSDNREHCTNYYESNTFSWSPVLISTSLVSLVK